MNNVSKNCKEHLKKKYKRIDEATTKIIQLVDEDKLFYTLTEAELEAVFKNVMQKLSMFFAMTTLGSAVDAMERQQPEVTSEE